MGTPYLGEIKILSFGFAPKGWALCNGQTLAINQYQALFAILGTNYGGNGTSTFNLPDLRGRMPVHPGNSLPLGGAGGEVTHVLAVNEMPAHSHPAAAGTTANSGSPVGTVFAAGRAPLYASTANTTMNAAAISSVGFNQPHQNQPPYLVLNFIIALTGIFPSRN